MPIYSSRTGEQWTLNGSARVAHDGAGEAWVRLPGAVGSYVVTPDSAALDVTGDIDIRFKIAADDWTPTASQVIAYKYVGGNSGNAYGVIWAFTGQVTFVWSDVDTVGPGLNASSNLNYAGVADGQPAYLRITMDVDNGAGGRTITFWRSTDEGATWTFFSSATQAGVTSINPGSKALHLGIQANAISNPFAGKIYWVEVRNGIDGPVVARFDALDGVAASSSAIARTGVPTATIAPALPASPVFRSALTSEVWSLNGAAAIAYEPGSAWLDLEAASTDFASTPDASALDVTADIDIRAKFRCDGTPSTNQTLLARFAGVGQNAYMLRLIVSTGRLRLSTSSTGSDLPINTDSTASVSTTGDVCARVTVDVDNGSGSKVLTFYTSADNGVTWTILGSAITTAGTTSIKNSTDRLTVGKRDDIGEPFAGRIYWAEVRNGIDGPVVVRFDALNALPVESATIARAA